MDAAVAPDWSAADVPAAERPDAVREALSRSHLPWDLDFEPGAAVECALTSHELAGASLVECRSGVLRGRRRPARAPRDDEHVGLLVVLAGRERVRQGDVVVDLRPGDALVWRSGLPASFEVLEPLHKVTLLLPAERLGGADPGPSPLVGARPATRLLAGHLATLAGLARELPALDAGFVVDVAVDLVRRAAADRGAADRVAAGRGALLRRAVEVIDRSLDDPSLSPAAVAAELGVSTRWLQQAFADGGTTITAHVRRRRLERVRRDLADPRLADRTVTAIAFRHGFTDSATLSRQFRAAFGTTPTAYRAARAAPLS